MRLLPSLHLWVMFLAVVVVALETGSSLIDRDVVSSPGDLCAASETRVAIVDQRLYFMGGRYTFNQGDTDSFEPKLYWLNLNTSFPVDGLISSNFLYSTFAQTNQWNGEGVFFTDTQQTTLYSFGGLLSNPQTNIISAYNVTRQSWANVTVSGGDFNFDMREETLHATSDTGGQGLGFVSGGWDDVPGMVRFNANDTNDLKWTNETVPDVPLTLGGMMQYVRYGREGVLIAFGGYNKDYVNTALTGWLYDLRSMQIISVYDIASKKWFNVTATAGPAGFPSQRSEFCSVLSASPDDSSMQITMYGGWGLFAGRAYEDIWILTIPAFRWIKVDNSGSSILKIADVVGMQGHHCALYNDRQMVVLGGNVYVGNEKVNGNTCNTSYPAVRVLDTTDYSWQSSFNDQPEAYQVPSQVYNVVGGDAKGGATMKAPKGGFNGTALPRIFSQTVARYTAPTATSTQSSAAGSPSSSSSPKSSSSNTGAIAGGVVGGVLGLAFIAGLAYWIVRRRRTKHRRTDIPRDGDSAVGSDIPMNKAAATENAPFPEMPGYRDGEDREALYQELDSGYRGQEMEGARENPLVELPAANSPRR